MEEGLEMQHDFGRGDIPDLNSETLPTGESRFVICFDYGTTFSGIAWSIANSESQNPDEVFIVNKWQGTISDKVPSQLTFSPADPRWGNIKHARYVIRLSKLRFEPSKRLVALEALSQAAEDIDRIEANSRMPGPMEFPHHLAKSSPEVATIYLTEVARNALRQIQLQDAHNTLLLEEYPIDLVITHPAEWTYEARNQIFRAVTKAFNAAFDDFLARKGDIRMMSEPEACAQWTMRDAKTQGIDRLQKDQCFTVVDAGGGTVDLVSYIVEQVTPTFKFRKFSTVCGDSVGASCIDNYFLNTFLRRKLGDEYLNIVNTTGVPASEQYGQGSHVTLNKKLQGLLEKFQTIKHNFRGPGDRTARFDLSGDIRVQNDPSRGIMNGQLLITSDELVEMFQYSVEGTLRLLWDQYNQVIRLGSQVKAVFLSGGFSGSPYLHSRIKAMARECGFDLIRANNGWSAVVRGGVLTGLGLGCEQPAPSVACPCHIGIVMAEPWREYKHDRSQHYNDTFDKVERATGIIKWVVNKGDLILPNQDIHITRNFRKRFTSNSGKSGRLKVIILRLDGFGVRPTRVSDLAASSFGPDNEAHLQYDLGALQHGAQPTISPGRDGTYDWLEMELEIRINQRCAELELLTGKVQNAFGQTVSSGLRLDFHRVDFPSVEPENY